MSVKFLVLGGGLGGGGECRFYFHGREYFSEIRIAAITLASDSAITTARFRPSKLPECCVGITHVTRGTCSGLTK